MPRQWLALVVFLVACGPAAHGGLSNAAGAGHAPTPDDGREDAIANGPASCPPSGKRSDDALRARVPACPEAGPPAPSSSNRRPGGS